MPRQDNKSRLIRLGDAKRLTQGGDGPGLEMITFRHDQG